MSKSGKVWRKEVYEKARSDFYAGIYYNRYASGSKQEELYQRYWLQVKRDHDWCEAWF